MQSTLLNHLKNNGAKILVLADQALVSGGNFLLGIVLIRLLGLSDYGIFALLWMGVLFALNLHQAFITKPMMTLAIKGDAQEQQDYFKNLASLQIAIGLVVFVLSVLLSSLLYYFGHTTNWATFLFVTSSLSIVHLLQDFVKKTFFLQKKYGQPLWMDMLNYGSLLMGIAYLYNTDSISITTILLLQLFANSLGSIIYGKDLLKINFRAASASWKALIKKHYHFSSWLLGTSILQWFSGNFILITAASTLGTTAVGAVRMGQNIVGLCHVLFLAMENIVPAEAAQHFLKPNDVRFTVHGSRFTNLNSVKAKLALERLQQYLFKVTIKMGAVVLMLLGLMTIAAPNIVLWIYGASYVPYTYVVWGFCLLYSFVFLGYPFRYYFRTLHFTKPIFIAYCWSAFLSMVLAFPLVQYGQITGVLLGLILSQIAILVVYGYYCKVKAVPFDNAAQARMPKLLLKLK